MTRSSPPRGYGGPPSNHPRHRHSHEPQHQDHRSPPLSHNWQRGVAHPPRHPLNHRSRKQEPEVEQDPFCNSGGEEEEEDSCSSDGDDVQAEKAYQKHLPSVSKAIEESCVGGVMPQTDFGDRPCDVCPTLQWFKGWKALRAHAQTFKKKRPLQHRGYARALVEAIAAFEKKSSARREEENPEGPVAQKKTAFLDPEAALDRLIVWPPAVLVWKATRKGGSSEASSSLQGLLPFELSELHAPRVLEVPPHRWVVVFDGSAVGYFAADLLQQKIQGVRSVHGRVAEPSDMERIDPQRQLFDWTTKKYKETVHAVQKKAKQEHDKEYAQLKAMEVRVENLAENEKEALNVKRHLEYTIQQKQKEIEDQKKRALDLEHHHMQLMNRIDSDFQREMNIFEARSMERIGQLRGKLESSEKQLEELRHARLHEIEKLNEEFSKLTEAQKSRECEAIEKEIQALDKAQKLMNELQEAESRINKEAHKQEMLLLEQQQREMMELEEEAKKEREQLLEEWLQKQQLLKKQVEGGQNLKEIQEEVDEGQTKECAICMDDLDKENRSCFKECGHARLCLDCATDVYNEKKFCPFCRIPLEGFPELVSKIFM